MGEPPLLFPLTLCSSLFLFYLHPAGEKPSSHLKQQDLWPQCMSCTPITTPDNRHTLKPHARSHCNSVTFHNSIQWLAAQRENNTVGQRHANGTSAGNKACDCTFKHSCVICLLRSHSCSLRHRKLWRDSNDITGSGMNTDNAEFKKIVKMLFYCSSIFIYYKVIILCNV